MKGRSKALHVLVPEAAHMQARMAAIASRLPFRTFMAHLMMSATPIEAPPSYPNLASCSYLPSYPNPDSASTSYSNSASVSDSASYSNPDSASDSDSNSLSTRMKGNK